MSEDPFAMAEKFRNIPTALISDNLDRIPAAVGLRPFHKEGHMVGVALTVKTRPGDNRAVHEALDLIKRGMVVVIDGGGYLDRALIGDLIVTLAKKRGAAGMVVDGAIRDIKSISADTFPCFARCAIHAGPYKDGPGRINVPISIGGMVVNPGDIVVGDEDGVLAFSVDGAEQLLGLVAAQEQREDEILRSIEGGTFESFLKKSY